MDKFTLAKYIITKYNGDVTPMKLQKLLYYCYAWQLVAGEKKFDATFEAWPHGPVEPEIYEAYKSFGRSPIQIADSADSIEINEPTLDFILKSYSVFSTIELSKTTHMEKPWKLYKDSNKVIPDNTLIDFYQKQPFAWNFPIADGKKFYPPKTSSHYAFTFDMEKDYVPEFESIEDYLSGFMTAEKEFLELLYAKSPQN